MPRRSTILYCFGWILYVIFSITMFPVLNISVGIPTFFLIGIGAWLFGTTKGLGLILGMIFYHMILFSFIYPNTFETYQTKISSPMVMIIIAYLSGYLKRSHDNLRSLNHKLDRLVKERTEQLQARTAKLLASSEKIKIANGQELHDGIGQQLTGVQLLSSTLSEQLLDEINPATAISHHLKVQTNNVHNHIRKISRLLFPVRIEQIGLIPALNELVSCLNAIKPIRASVIENEELPPLPEHLLLQLFRICQESALYVTDHHRANRLSFNITTAQSNIVITIKHNGAPSSASPSVTGASNLIHYRLKLVNGTQHFHKNSPEKQTKTFIIPLQSIPA